MFCAQLRAVVQFFELKQKQYCKEIHESVQDVALERSVQPETELPLSVLTAKLLCSLIADVYNRDDVEEIMDAAAENAAAASKKILEQQVNMSALLMEQVYVAALQAGVKLSLDLSQVEDEGMTCSKTRMQPK